MNVEQTAPEHIEANWTVKGNFATALEAKNLL